MKRVLCESSWRLRGNAILCRRVSKLLVVQYTSTTVEALNTLRTEGDGAKKPELGHCSLTVSQEDATKLLLHGHLAFQRS